jgi:hypothetical protein
MVSVRLPFTCGQAASSLLRCFLEACLCILFLTGVLCRSVIRTKLYLRFDRKKRYLSCAADTQPCSLPKPYLTLLLLSNGLGQIVPPASSVIHLVSREQLKSTLYSILLCRPWKSLKKASFKSVYHAILSRVNLYPRSRSDLNGRLSFVLHLLALWNCTYGYGV